MSALFAVRVLLLLLLLSTNAWSQTTGPIVDLTAQPNVVTAGIGTATLVTCRITDPNVLANTVFLQRLDGANSVTGTFGSLHDDGQGGDTAAGDGIFSGQFSINEAAPGILRLRVSAGIRGNVVNRPKVAITQGIG